MCCSLDILLTLRHSASGDLEGELCGKETLFSTKTISRMCKHFKVCTISAASSEGIKGLWLLFRIQGDTFRSTSHAFLCLVLPEKSGSWKIYRCSIPSVGLPLLSLLTVRVLCHSQILWVCCCLFYLWRG